MFLWAFSFTVLWSPKASLALQDLTEVMCLFLLRHMLFKIMCKLKHTYSNEPRWLPWHSDWSLVKNDSHHLAIFWLAEEESSLKFNLIDLTWRRWIYKIKVTLVKRSVEQRGRSEFTALLRRSEFANTKNVFKKKKTPKFPAFTGW